MPDLVITLDTAEDLDRFDLDGFELQDGDTTLLRSITWNPARKKGDWVTSADSDGSVPAGEEHYENAEMECRVEFDTQATMDAALDLVGDLTAKFQKARRTEGGIVLTWTPPGSSLSCLVYVLDGEFTDIPKSMSGDDAGFYGNAPVVVFRLVCLPFLYDTEETLLGTLTFDDPQGELVVTIGGDVPAIGRLKITDTDGVPRQWAEWGREAGTDLTYPLLIDSDDFVTSGYLGADFGALVTAAVQNSPGVLFSTGPLEHIGPFNLRARLYAATADIRLRMAYRVGDGEWTTNAWVKPPVFGAGVFCEMDLGSLLIEKAEAGAQQAEIQIEGKTVGMAGDVVIFDFLRVLPTASHGTVEVSGIARTPRSFAAFDGFDQSAPSDNLTGKSIPTGASWTNVSGDDGADFVLSPSFFPGHALRGVLADVNLDHGRILTRGTANYTDITASVESFQSTTLGNVPSIIYRMGVAYVVDIDNLFLVCRTPGVGAGSALHYVDTLSVFKRIAGTTTLIASAPSSLSRYDPGATEITKDAAGNWTARFYDGSTSGPVLAELSGQADDLKTGGALASAKIGLYDAFTASSPVTDRYYDNFAAAVPAESESVIYADQSLEISDQDIRRWDPTGTFYSEPKYRGSQFLLTQEGDEGFSNRIVASAKRRDPAASDAAISDETRIDVYGRRRWLAVPHSD